MYLGEQDRDCKPGTKVLKPKLSMTEADPILETIRASLNGGNPTRMKAACVRIGDPMKAGHISLQVILLNSLWNTQRPS